MKCGVFKEKNKKKQNPERVLVRHKQHQLVDRCLTDLQIFGKANHALSPGFTLVTGQPLVTLGRRTEGSGAPGLG